jgi:hypothetical protein
MSLRSPARASTRVTAPDAGRDAAKERTESARGARSTFGTTTVTRVKFAASLQRTWATLLFYEQIEGRPPLHLRLLLPVPMRTEGRKSNVGDAATCVYESGRLVKRVTRIEHGRHLEFEVVEQNLAVGRGIRLSGGAYRLRELSDGRTEVALTTRHVSAGQPRWFWTRVETIVCHMFHRHILRAMRHTLHAR